MKRGKEMSLRDFKMPKIKFKKMRMNLDELEKIDYEKVDVSKLIALEGEEDNIYENNIPKLNKYLELGKKVGVTCSESTL